VCCLNATKIESEGEPNYADQIFPEQLQIKYPDHIYIPPLSQKEKYSFAAPICILSLSVCVSTTGGGKNPLSDEMVRFDWTEAANQERLAGKSLNDDRQD
jgi:hypothetical protein